MANRVRVTVRVRVRLKLNLVQAPMRLALARGPVDRQGGSRPIGQGSCRQARRVTTNLMSMISVMLRVRARVPACCG